MKNLLLLLGLFIHFQSFAQSQHENITDRAFLTLLVIPYTSADETVRSLVEDSRLARVVINRINDVLSERGYRTKDYAALLRLPMVAPTAADLERSEVKEAIKNSSVDIVIYVEIRVEQFGEKDRQLQLSIQAIDQYSAENYANSALLQSNRRHYDVANIANAVNDNLLAEQLKQFTDRLDRKFVDLINNGRTFTVQLYVSPEQPFNLHSLLNDQSLDLIGGTEQWIRGRALRMYPSGSDSNYWRAECKVKVNDYSFKSDFKAFLRQLSIEGQRLAILNETKINARVEIELGLQQ